MSRRDKHKHKFRPQPAVKDAAGMPAAADAAETAGDAQAEADELAGADEADDPMTGAETAVVESPVVASAGAATPAWVPAATPFLVLADYEQRSLAHVAGLPEQIDAPGLWRGIAFRVAGKLMVSSIAEVNEILTYPTLTFVPGTRPWLLGVANVRGNLVPVIDLRGFVEGEKNTHNERSRVLVVKQQGGNVGLLVDEVLGQRSFVDENEVVGAVEEDERYRRYVPKQFDLGGVRYLNFSVHALVRDREFVQAAA